LDLGVFTIHDHQFRLTYALRQPPSDAATVTNARSAGLWPVVLLPTGDHDNVTGISTILLDRPLLRREEMIRAIAATFSLTDQLPAVLTVPNSARLVVDTRRGTVWFDKIEMTNLKPSTHQFRFVEALAKAAPAAVSKQDLCAALSAGREDGEQAARSAKLSAKKAIRDALEAKGLKFEDRFRSENGRYRLTVQATVT
jgi:hypothetical protein